MAISRYAGIQKIDQGRGFATVKTSSNIRNAIKTGVLSYSTITLKEGQRLDILAGQRYGDASLWWIIAAASGIGWGLQVPPGTIISIPDNPGAAMALIS